MDISLWYGIVVPAATPQAIVQRLNAELAKILDMADVRRSFADQGADVEGGTADAFGAFMREERARWGAVVKQAGITAQ
jgi:tripartite-type tricarboxylate transporter receptor subunit TctC